MATFVPDTFADVLQLPEVRTQVFSDDGTFPNNQELPVLGLGHAVQETAGDLARSFERVFRAHDWRGTWRDGIFSYHHYHSTAHEVLGVASGSARVQLGGPGGEVFDVEAGDVVILPAGVAHKNLGADRDFLVVGAYPARCSEWDLKKGRPGERREADRNIEQVPLPARDPVYGDEGPLVEHWNLSG